MASYIVDKNNVTSIEASGVTKPSDRHFRNAWVLNSDRDVVTEDLATAKILFKENRLIRYEGSEYNRKTYLINWANDRVWRFSILLKPQSRIDYENQADKIARSIHELSEDERILGRPLKQKTQEGFFRIGLFLLFSLMFFVTFNDLKDLGLF